MATGLDNNELRLTACRLAQLGGDTARSFFGKVSMSQKKDDTPVTEADHVTQDAILAAIAQEFPSHAVIVEEVVRHPDRHAEVENSPYCWVIDPIDGTRNFGRGFPIYSTSVGVMREGRPVACAIYDASTGQLYSAAWGGGAYRDAQRLQIHERQIDTNTTIAVGSFRSGRIPDVVRGWMDRFQFRNLGSICLHLALVSAGLMEAAYALECKLWDVAAGSLLIREAGGVITNHFGRGLWPKDLVSYHGEDLPILAGSPQMHAMLLDELELHRPPA